MSFIQQSPTGQQLGLPSFGSKKNITPVEEKITSHHETEIISAEHREEFASSPVQATLEDDEKPELSWQTYLAIFALLVQYNAYLYTLIMPPAILAFINAELGPNKNYVWITICWNLAAAVLVTVSGRLADIFGRRWFLITGACLGCIGSIVGATGHSINQMIVSGVIFGIGGGFQEMCFSCLLEMVPNRYRFTLLGITELSNWPSQFGALIAYAFIAYVPLVWRTCYWWCLGWEFTSVVLLFLFYKPPSFETKHKEDHKTKFELLKELDYVGLVLFMAACTLLLLGINWGGSLYPWASSTVIAPLAVSGALFILLGFWEVYAPLRYPILPPRLFKKWRRFTAILVVVFVCGMLYYSNLVLWPRISSLLFVSADQLILRGLYATMPSFGVMAAGIYCIAVMPWVKHERWQLFGLAVVMTAAIGGLSSLTVSDKGKAIAFILIAGTASTSSSPLIFGMMSLGLDDQADIGVAIGLVSTSRLIGGAIATAIYTSIYSNHYAGEIPAQIAAAAKSSGFTGSVAALLTASATNTAAAYNAVAGMTPGVIAAAQSAVKVAYVDSFHLVFEVAIAFGTIGMIAALCTKSVEVSKRSNDRAVRLENEKSIVDSEKLGV